MSDYPSEADLDRIRTWPFDDPHGWLDAIRAEWWAVSWGWHEETVVDEIDGPVRRVSISTGGWSGNEDRIRAMTENAWLWGRIWESSRRGGHYVLQVPLARSRV